MEKPDFDILKKQAPLNWMQIFIVISIVASSVWVAGEIYHKFNQHDILLEYHLSPDNGRVDRKLSSMKAAINKNSQDIENLKFEHDAKITDN